MERGGAGGAGEGGEGPGVAADRAHAELDELLEHDRREVGVGWAVLQLRVAHEQH